MFVLPHSVQLISVSPSQELAQSSYAVEHSYPTGEASGLVVHPALYQWPSSPLGMQVLVGNYSALPYNLHKGDLLAEAAQVSDTYHLPSPEEVSVNILTYDTPQAKSQHWQKVKPRIVFGDHSHETRVARQQLLELAEQFHDVFALNLTELGEAKGVEFDIELTSKPPKQQPRRLPFQKRAEVYRVLQEAIDAGILVHSRGSEYASPIVAVRKHDGSLRVCSDFRLINASTVINAATLPRVDDIYQSIAAIRPRFFSSLDLLSGYHQIKMSEKAQKISAIVVGAWHLNWTRMPFGLCNSPAWFMDYMQRTLGDVDPDRIHIFLDDVIVVSEDLPSHLALLEKVFARLRENQLRLKPKKCEFLCREVKFLGLVLDKFGLRTDPSKIEAISNYPVPKNVKQVRQFLGCAGYFRRFCDGFSTIAKPLTRLQEKGAPFDWTPACQNAVDTLKKKLVSAPILAHPDFSKPFYIETDASGEGVGAQLLQRVDSDPTPNYKTLGEYPKPLIKSGDFRPIAFISKAFNRHERNYCASEQEGLAVVHACKEFSSYCYRLPVYVITDCVALTALLSSKSLTGRLARWAMVIQSLAPIIIYRAGRKNEMCDGLSRRPWDKMQQETGIDEGGVSADVHQLHYADHELDGRVLQLTVDASKEEVRKAQLQDDFCANLIRFLEDGTLTGDTKEQRERLVFDSRLYLMAYGMLMRNDGLTAEMRLVVPSQERQTLLKEAHNLPTAGHGGPNKTYSRLVTRFFWPGLWKQTQKYCHSCLPCAMRRGNHAKHKVPMMHVPYEYRPMHTISIDVHEVGPSESGNKYTILAYDLFFQTRRRRRSP